MSKAELVVVEDDVDLLQGWRELFEFAGYGVRAYTSAEAALADRAALADADILVTDYHLADLNGVEFIREARRVKPGLPALVLTGLKHAAVADAVQAAGDITLFYKPVSLDEVEQHLARLVERLRP